MKLRLETEKSICLIKYVENESFKGIKGFIKNCFYFYAEALQKVFHIFDDAEI